jgi:hypothetical protein
MSAGANNHSERTPLLPTDSSQTLSHPPESRDSSSDLPIDTSTSGAAQDSANDPQGLANGSREVRRRTWATYVWWAFLAIVVVVALVFLIKGFIESDDTGVRWPTLGSSDFIILIGIRSTGSLTSRKLSSQPLVAD